MRILEEMAVDGFPESGYRRRFVASTSTARTLGQLTGWSCTVIPPSSRGEVLSSLHAAHQGVSMMTTRPESSVFWPGMSADICTTLNNCEHCHQMAPARPLAPPTPPTPAFNPFQAVCSDFFMHRGVHFLVTVDCYSNWPIVSRWTGGAADLICHLRHTERVSPKLYSHW